MRSKSASDNFVRDNTNFLNPKSFNDSMEVNGNEANGMTDEGESVVGNSCTFFLAHAHGTLVGIAVGCTLIFNFFGIFGLYQYRRSTIMHRFWVD